MLPRTSTDGQAAPFPEDLRVLGSALSVQRIPLTASEAPDPQHVDLWLVAEHIDLNAHCATLMTSDAAPYWAFCWGSGQALARFVLERPERVRGKHVVDFGAGCGVAGIASAMAGAGRVTAVDIDPQARRFCQHNAALNGVELETAKALPERCDLILAADVLYHTGNLQQLQRLREAGADMLVADPQRPGNPRLSRPPLARYPVRTHPDVDYPMCQAAVYAL